MNIKKTIILFLLLSPLLGFAQTASYVPLEPLPGTVTGPLCDPNNPFITDPNNPANTIPNPNCTTNISTYIPSLFVLLIALAGGLAVIMIVVGGIQYLSTDAVSGKSEGKERITNALVGLLLAIAAYIILNTVNPQILQFNLKIPGTAPVVVRPVVPVPLPPASTTPPTTCNIGPSTACTKTSCLRVCPYGVPWITGDDAANRATLSTAGIAVNKPNCRTVGDTGCTSLTYLPQRAKTGLQGLARACAGCSITVTGATEFWPHVSHGPGMNRVDLGFSSLLDSFIRRGRSLATNVCYSGKPAWEINGATYVRESNHWHVCY